MKTFFTVRETQRGSQSYMETRRGRREIEVTRRRRGGIKRRESKLASNHFPMCSPQSGPLRDVHIYTEKKRGRKETEVARRIKGESKGERQILPVVSSLGVLHSLEHTKRFTEFDRERRGREETEATWWRKRRVQRRREQSSQ